MQPGDFPGETDWIAVAPACPEAALPAIIAQVRAAARELHDDRPPAAVVTVATGIDQLPADATGVQVLDHAGGTGLNDPPVAAKRDSIHVRQVAILLQQCNQAPCSLFTLAPNDDVDLPFAIQDFTKVIRWKDSAVDNGRVRQLTTNPPGELGDDRMRGSRAGVAEHQHLRAMLDHTP